MHDFKIQTALIIGVGNLGVRHLQSLRTVSEIKEIYALDANDISLRNASEVFESTEGAEGQNLHLLHNFDELPSEIDFAVIATGSSARKDLTLQLLDVCKVRFLLLEKFLFPKLSEYIEVQNKLDRLGTKIFVNCPRRMFDFYQDIKKAIEPEKPIVMLVNGGNLTVGTHAIHFLDLFAYITGVYHFEHINLSMLNPEIYDSKRDGYIEFKGTIIVTSGKNTFIFQTYEGSDMPLQVVINQGHIRYNVLEHESIVKESSSKNKWTENVFTIHKPWQSELTGILVKELSEKGKTELTEFNESAKIHKQLLVELLKFMNNKLGVETDICNIT